MVDPAENFLTDSQPHQQPAPAVGEQQAGPEAYTTPDGKFTPAHVGQLFYDSFRFSQGSPGIQEQIYKYLVKQHGDQLSTELIDEGAAIVAPRIIGFVAKGIKHVERDNMHAGMALQTEVNVWKSTLRDMTKPNHFDPRGFDPHSMLTMILAHEAKFVNEGGRPNRTEGASKASRSHGKNVSQFVYYGLMGMDTGSPEYNELFAELVDSLHDIPDGIPKPDTTDPEPFTRILPIFASHFTAYPDDIARITPLGLVALRERFAPAELESLGIDPDMVAS